MGRKFDKILESVVQRYQVGGFLPGDIIKFRSDYKKSRSYHAMNSKMKQDVDELANSDLIIRVTQIGNDIPGESPRTQFTKAENAVITIAGDHGGGRTVGQVTVPAEMIDLAEQGDYFPRPPVPDEFVKVSSDGRPEEYKMDGTNITNVSDDGSGKYRTSQLKMPTESRLLDDYGEMGQLYESTRK